MNENGPKDLNYKCQRTAWYNGLTLELEYIPRQGTMREFVQVKIERILSSFENKLSKIFSYNVADRMDLSLTPTRFNRFFSFFFIFMYTHTPMINNYFHDWSSVDL